MGRGNGLGREGKSGRKVHMYFLYTITIHTYMCMYLPGVLGIFFFSSARVTLYK